MTTVFFGSKALVIYILKSKQGVQTKRIQFFVQSSSFNNEHGSVPHQHLHFFLACCVRFRIIRKAHYF